MLNRAMSGVFFLVSAILIAGSGCESSRGGDATEATDGKPAAETSPAPSENGIARKNGDMAPAFEAETVDGKPIKLSDYKGKYVLLDFWATWCGPCIAEMPYLKKVWAKHRDDPRFALLAVSLDGSPSEPKRFAEKAELGWTQGFLGQDKGWDVLQLYGQDGLPSVFLIDPEGRIIGYEVHHEEMIRAVDKALAGAKQERAN